MITAFRDEHLQVAGYDTFLMDLLDGLVRVHDHWQKQTDYTVNEQDLKKIEVQPAEPPDDARLFGHDGKRGEHVISIHECKQTLRRHTERAKLDVVRAEHHPATEAEAAVQEESAQ